MHEQLVSGIAGNPALEEYSQEHAGSILPGSKDAPSMSYGNEGYGGK
ncbi:hypothetical protein GCM10025779_26230 [Arthrobacter cryoconiti]